VNTYDEVSVKGVCVCRHEIKSWGTSKESLLMVQSLGLPGRKKIISFALLPGT